MKKSLALIILIVVSLFSCKEKVNYSSPAFIGYWWGTNSSATYALNIDIESHAVYKIAWPGSESVLMEGTARANTTRLNINSKQYFDIEEYPHVIDTTVELFYIPNPGGAPFAAHFKMILNGPHKADDGVPSGTWAYYK
jgi:hypothetical protein